MADDVGLWIEGNLTSDPVLRFTPDGVPVCEAGVAVNRTVEQNGAQVQRPDYYDLKIWRMQGENVHASLAKGDRVIAFGRLERRDWEDAKTGVNRYRFDFIVDKIGPSLRFARVDGLTKTAGRGVTPPPEAVAVSPNGEPVGEEPF